MKKLSVQDLVLQTMIASMYVVLVYVFQFMSFTIIQFRIAEILLILIFFDKKSIIGLTLGTFVANYLLSPFGIIDAVFGSLATLISLIFMWIFHKKPLIALSMPALGNGLVIGLMIAYIDQVPFAPIFFWVFLGEFVVMYVLALPLYLSLSKNKHFLEFFNHTNKK